MSDSNSVAPGPAAWPTPPAVTPPAGSIGGAVPGTLEQVLAQARAGDSAALARYLVLRRGVVPVARQG
ncbi:MAG: hypothetical protein WCI73_09655 [Phycisphaerae bacterium]